MKFLHLSDLHFHTKESDNTSVLNLLKHIEGEYPEHYLIITGDITDDGKDAQYKNALNNLKQFKGRVFICPGNHDFGATGFLYSASRAKKFDEELMIPLNQGGKFYRQNEPVINVVEENNEKVMLIALDSNLETTNPFDCACGEVGGNQLEYLDFVLSDPATINIPKIIFLHHHPFIISDPFMELKDAENFMRKLYGKVKILMFGHKHKSKYWSDHGGITHILAAENTTINSRYIREISISSNIISINNIEI